MWCRWDGDAGGLPVYKNLLQTFVELLSCRRQRRRLLVQLLLAAVAASALILMNVILVQGGQVFRIGLLSDALLSVLPINGLCHGGMIVASLVLVLEYRGQG